MKPPLALALLALPFAFGACSQSSPTPIHEQPLLERAVIPAANALAVDDPRFEGQQRFLWDSFGTEQLPDWPPAEFMLRLMADEPEVFGEQFASFGFIEDPNDDFPVGFKRGLVDPDRVHETCALCHVGELSDGRLWIGAPNANLDFGRFLVEVNDRWVTAGGESLATDLVLEKSAALGPGRARADSATFEQVVPADFPVYYDLGDRGHLNYLGTGRNLRTEAFLSLYTFGAGNPNPDEALVPFPSDDVIDASLVFLGTVDAPKGPAGDPEAIAAGARVFQDAGCGACHHVGDVSLDLVATHDVIERFPEDDPDFPRGSIATSKLHRSLQDNVGATEEGFQDLVQFIVDNELQAFPTDGYRVANLAGIWSSAPYLHNGSVPTLEALLSPASKRPTEFTVGGVVRHTTVPGNGNQGHEFGADLSDDDKGALLAYLRSL